ncbi:hypothetical protein K7432_002178 [Basidiobolus ranarum]|uniref:Cystinosin n=1 Tax=Basidiobolus ranarum TaxID=34480 RepID=A0ABR2W8A1_9FUNG
MGAGEVISQIIGWIYFLAWTVSFYPQLIQNYRRKSVQGLSVDFLMYNVVGFTCMTVYNSTFYWNSSIQDEYRQRNNGHSNLVAVNDVFFGMHAIIITMATIAQVFMYKRNPGQKPSWFGIALVTGCILGAVGYSIYIGVTGSFWIDFLYYLSYVKLGISFIKYCPQIWINYKSKSTVGWSIHNILLDMTGGSLSIVQLVLDAYLSNDFSGISGNPLKFGLGFISIVFDLIFIVQHYILYRDRTDIYQVEEGKVDIDIKQ